MTAGAAYPHRSTRPPNRSTGSLPAILPTREERYQLLSRDPPPLSETRTSSTAVQSTPPGQDDVVLSEDEDERGKKELMEPHEKGVDWVPWVISPLRGTEKLWIRQRDEAPEWLPLLFDLTVVAVLTVFSFQHALAVPADIPNFLSFFVIVFWTWVSQTAFDIRYQANDSLNRFWKFCQIVLFLFQGASSGHWQPGAIRQDVPDELSSRAVRHEDAFQSFLVVGLAFCISRALLATQYIVLWMQARHAKRRTRHIVVTVVTLFISGVFALFAVAIPADNRAQHYTKIALFYAGISIEVAETVAQVFLRFVPHVSTRKVAERYGAFSLIILGDAIVSISRAFNIAISGLSDTDPNTYFQVFLVILILFLCWIFLFSHFDKTDRSGAGRAAFWQIVHFPLSFAILLMVGAMVNVVILVASNQGIELVSRDLIPLLNTVTANDTDIATADFDRLNRYLTRLDLQPPFPQMYEALTALSESPDPEFNINVTLIQYLGQIVYSTYSLYNVPIPDEARDAYLDALSVNQTLSSNATLNSERVATVLEGYFTMGDSIANASYSGILWLFPSAGAVLLLISLRLFLWSRLPHRLQILHHAAFIIGGLVLIALSFLAVGNKRIDILNYSEEGGGTLNPLYRLLERDLPLVLVAIVYTLVWLVKAGINWWAARRAGLTGGTRRARRERRLERKRRKRGQEGHEVEARRGSDVGSNEGLDAQRGIGTEGHEMGQVQFRIDVGQRIESGHAGAGYSGTEGARPAPPVR